MTRKKRIAYIISFFVVFGLLSIPVLLGWYRIGDAICMSIGCVIAEGVGQYIKRRFKERKNK